MSAVHDVAISFVRTGLVSDDAVSEARALLSDAERARAARFRFARDERQHVLLSALGRRALAYALGGDDALARALVFESGPRGRPEVVAPDVARGLRFNLSKTSGLVVVAVTRALTVGVDVEHLARPIDVSEVAPVALHPRERAALSLLDDEALRARAFLRLWTLKEAYTKARGLGLFLPVTALAFDVRDDEVTSAHFEADIGDDPARWCFTLVSPVPAHQVAVVVERPQVPLSLTVTDVTTTFTARSARSGAPTSATPRSRHVAE